MLTQPLPDLAAWTAHFHDAPIPVLASTADDLALLARLEDQHGNVDAHAISEAIGDDPLMTLRLLALAGRQRHARQVTDAETVTAAVVMLGIGPFFRACTDLPVAEAVLGAQPDAWSGLERVLHRVHRAARFAIGFAAQRMDDDAAVMRQAALLHDFADLLLWCHAPALALEIERRLQADPAQSPQAVQREVLNVALADLELALMRAWRLPERLIRLRDDQAPGAALIRPQFNVVRLAVRMARQRTDGWDDPALADDVAELAGLLTLSTSATRRLLAHIDS